MAWRWKVKKDQAATAQVTIGGTNGLQTRELLGKAVIEVKMGETSRVPK